MMKVADVFSKLTTEPRPGLKKVDSEPGRGQRADDNVAGDRVDLSMRSREAGKMKEVLQATPDERLAMIESLKKEIGQGTYRVDSLKIADKMLDNLLTEQEIIDK